MENKQLKTEFEIIIAGKDLNDLLDKFKLINPTHYTLFRITTERKALERLVVQFGYDKIAKAIEIAAQTNGMEFAPTITTPYQMEKKWGQWVAFLWRQKGKKSNKVML